MIAGVTCFRCPTCGRELLAVPVDSFVLCPCGADWQLAVRWGGRLLVRPASRLAVLADLPEEWFPLILKATYGDNSQGLRLIRHPEDLADLHWTDALVLAQHYLPNDGFDLKLYVCGQQVFAVRKPSPFNGAPKASAQPVQPDQSVVELALRCGATFGLEVYGVDTIETPNGLAVIEVNEFPNFTGVPGVADHLADHILARVCDTGGVAHAHCVRPAPVSA